MKNKAAAVGGAEACVKPSRAKASSYAGLQAAATIGGPVEGRGRPRFAIHISVQLRCYHPFEMYKIRRIFC